MWKLQHTDGHREMNELHVPIGQPVRLTMASEDVIHSFYVPAFRFKRDVVPGRFSAAWFEATKPGKYHLFCAEYCGTRHSNMIGWVYAMKPADYQAWLAGGTPGETLAAGRRASGSSSTPATPATATQPGARGPSLAGLFGKPVRLAERADRRRRRGLHPRIHRQPAGQARRGLSADHADVPGPDQRGGPPAADRVHQVPVSAPAGRRAGRGQPAPSPRSGKEGLRAMSTTSESTTAPRVNYLNVDLRRALVAADDRPQADRDPVPDRRHVLLRDRRPRRRAHPPGAADARPATSSRPRPTTRSSRRTAS